MNNTNKKVFISEGCSFSQVPNADTTWPYHLSQILQPEHTVYGGLGAAGNRIISRLTIYHVLEYLEKGYEPNDILVGIMWSGRTRMDVYTSRPDFPHNSIPVTDWQNRNYQNPTWLRGEERYQYLIHVGWDDPSSMLYYENFYDDADCMLNTIEQVLRTQWFLDGLGIDYFMMEYEVDCITQHTQELLSQADIKPLFDQINFDYWPSDLPMGTWVKKYHIPYSRPNDDHPSTYAHQRFVNEFIVPHLTQRNILF